MSPADELKVPLHFAPVYQNVVWGGRRMARWRDDLPDGPVGESWEISQQARGVTVVDEGPLAGRSLSELTETYGRHLIGDGFTEGDDFPLLIKLIDARDRLSVQVHPDDELARSLGVGQRGKTECWYVIGEGGMLFQGTHPGVDRARFQQAIEAMSDEAMEACLQRFQTRDGDFFFIPARTVHAIGGNTVIWEIQQNCDVTFRVSDWGRVWDGQRRQLHVAESLQTIDFHARAPGPIRTGFEECPGGGDVRPLVACPYFSVEERRADHTEGGGGGACSVVICVSGYGRIATAGGHLQVRPMSSYLIPASAGAWSATADAGETLRLLVATPH